MVITSFSIFELREMGKKEFKYHILHFKAFHESGY